MTDADRQGVTDNSQDRTPKPSNPPEEGSKGKPQRDKGDKGNETTPTTGANATPEVEGPAFGGGGDEGNEHRGANTPPAQLTPPEGAAGGPEEGQLRGEEGPTPPKRPASDSRVHPTPSERQAARDIAREDLAQARRYLQEGQHAAMAGDAEGLNSQRYWQGQVSKLELDAAKASQSYRQATPWTQWTAQDWQEVSLDAAMAAGGVAGARGRGGQSISMSAAEVDAFSAGRSFVAPNGTVVKLPNAASMSNVEARTWYLQQEMTIPDLLATDKTLQAQAKQAHSLRNTFRTEARVAMQDQEVASQLNATNPNLTWGEVLAKYSKTYSGDELWQQIVNASQRSRATVNQKMGVTPPRTKK